MIDFALTRKHFNVLADALALIDRKDASFNLCCSQIADLCQSENPNFKRAQFLEACGAKTYTFKHPH